MKEFKDVFTEIIEEVEKQIKLEEKEIRKEKRRDRRDYIRDYDCPECLGNGNIRVLTIYFDPFYTERVSHSCPMCNGHGKIDWIENIKKTKGLPNGSKIGRKIKKVNGVWMTDDCPKEWWDHEKYGVDLETEEELEKLEAIEYDDSGAKDFMKVVGE